MTKKHFIELADYIRKPSGCEPFTEQQIDHLAHFCRSQNYNFNYERWIGYIKGENGPNGGKVKP